jgi:hypothetical protein
MEVESKKFYSNISRSIIGLEFKNQVGAGLICQIVHGRSRRLQTQESVERANGDFQRMLRSWMRENKNQK